MFLGNISFNSETNHSSFVLLHSQITKFIQ